jgi:Glycosyltransferase family 87
MDTSIAWSNRFKAIVFGLGLGLALLSSGNWWKILTDHVPLCLQPNCVADFVMFHAQAKLAWEDRHSLYDLEKQLAYQKRLAPIEQVLPAVYPPSTFLLMAPLALAPFSTAFLAVTVLNLLLLAATVRRLTRALSLTPDQSQWLSLFTLCNFGVHAVVFYGQTSALVLYLMTRHVIATKQLQARKSGIWAGLLCIKPQFLLMPHLVFLIRRSWRELVIGVLVSTSLILGGFALIGSATTKQYFSLAQRMVSADKDWWNQWRAMHNLRALTIYWLPGNWQPYVWAVGAVGTIAAIILVNLRLGGNSREFATRWIINLLGLLILIPHLFTHDLTLLVLPAALLLSQCGARVPVWVGVGLATIGLLPAVNYLLPTIMALALLLLFIASLFFARATLALPQKG